METIESIAANTALVRAREGKNFLYPEIYVRR